MDIIIMSILISLIVLLNYAVIVGPFTFMEGINVEDGIVKVCFYGMNELNQRKIFVKNVVYKFYFKNPKYNRENFQLYRYVSYKLDSNYHYFEVIKSKSIKYSDFVLVKVYGNKNDMRYITHMDDEILKITAALEYSL